MNTTDTMRFSLKRNRTGADSSGSRPGTSIGQPWPTGTWWICFNHAGIGSMAHTSRSNAPVLYFSNIILICWKPFLCFNFLFFFLINFNSNNGDNADHIFLLFHEKLRLWLKKTIVIFFISLCILIIYFKKIKLYIFFLKHTNYNLNYNLLYQLNVYYKIKTFIII